MTNSVQLTNSRVETYMGRLDAALSGMASAEKQDILREIRAHILDSVTVTADRDKAIEGVLHLLGAPEELAQRYNTEHLLARASHSFSPWLLLLTTWRWAKLGMRGTLAFLLAVIGFGLALGLTITVLLKPLMPSRIGVWWGRGNLIIGLPGRPEGMHELLGQWFVPVIVVIAFATAVGTTQGLRWLIRRRSPRPAY